MLILTTGGLTKSAGTLFFALPLQNIKASLILFCSVISYLCAKARRFNALALKNIEVNFIFLARFYYLWDNPRR